MAEHNGAQHQPGGPFAGEPRQRGERRKQSGWNRTPRRAARWLAWWVLMMSLWVAIDDSLHSDELLAGAGAAALAALAAELVTYQAATRLNVRPRWLLAAFRLPWQLVRDTGVVYSALARLLLRRERPRSEFAELPVAYGDDSALGGTRRVLLTWARSFTPGMFVLGFDAERDVMVVHRLLPDRSHKARR